MEIYKEFTFDSAHKLPNVPRNHKCGRMHGHTYKLEVWCGSMRRYIDSDTGWIIDYADIKAAVDPILDELDHRCLNEITGLENPTTEVLVQWVWKRLQPRLSCLTKLVIHESSTTGCVLTRHG